MKKQSLSDKKLERLFLSESDIEEIIRIFQEEYGGDLIKWVWVRESK